MHSIHKLCCAKDVVHENTLTKEMTSSLKTAKVTTSGNVQVERFPKLPVPALPPILRRERRLMPAQQERLESITAHQPDINTLCGSRRVTKYAENFGSPQVVHLPPVKTSRHLASTFRSKPNLHFGDKHRRSEYQASYGPTNRTRHFSIPLYRQLKGTP
ncbi:uncharacterized protein LOC128611313 isoform X2 [Ictalurus furcatus]|uniref:uncharacterized protein LOC128611313 isoform X2 n=1 Tax=Ictalurus furcatus TaxID=66913 RepID=UPI00234FB654|nr:uncharacterized protein LOC128611313 isoform X2 [Ictalurus furcatus]